MAKNHKITQESVESLEPNRRANGYQVQQMIKAFQVSPHQFLDQLQYLQQTLDRQIEKHFRYDPIARSKPWEPVIAEYILLADEKFDLPSLQRSASDTYHAWEVLRESGVPFADFDGSTLWRLTEIFRRRDYLEPKREGCEFDDFPQRYSEFEAAIGQFASGLDGSGTGPGFEPTQEQIQRVENALRDLGINAKADAVAKKARMRREWAIKIMKLIKARTV